MELSLKCCDNDACETWFVTNQGAEWISVHMPGQGGGPWLLCSSACAQVFIAKDPADREASRRAVHQRWLDRGEKENGAAEQAPAARASKREGKRR